MNATAQSKTLPEFKKHKFNVFPEMQPEEFDRLRTDIFMNGYDPKQPVWIYQGAIIDGWNRYQVCKALGIVPPFQEFKGSTLEAVQFIVRTNNRRDLNSSQRAAIAVEAEDLIAALKREARERQLSTLKQGSETPSPVVQLIAQRENGPEQNKVRTQLAETFGTNRQYVSDAANIKAEDPEAFKAIKSGKKTITQHKREAKEKHREERRKANAEKAAAVPDPIEAGARFATIMLDPPWDWGDEGDINQMGRAKPDYATMSLHELLNLPIPDLSDNDCHLYMWITNRSLPKGFQLIERWGFRYITMLTWPKPSFGMGNYFRGQTEHILFGVKGSQALKRKDAPTLLPAWSRGPNGHSSKPKEIYNFIESCSPGPYLEMFSRVNREGWKTWGADV